MSIEKYTKIHKIIGIIIVLTLGAIIIYAVSMKDKENETASNGTGKISIARENETNEQNTNVNTQNNTDNDTEELNQYNFKYVDTTEKVQEVLPTEDNDTNANITVDENGEPAEDREYTGRIVVIDGVEYTIYE